MLVAHGCCVGSWDRFDQYVLPSANGRPVIALSGQTSIAAAYNTILNGWDEQGVDMGILQHDDLEIIEPNSCIDSFAAAFAGEGHPVLLGVAGGSARGGLAWWNHNPIGHQYTDARLLDFGPREGIVDLLEGSLLVFSGWAIRWLRFSDRPGFHGYDEIAYAAKHRYGKVAAVVDVATHHHTQLGFDHEQSERDWLEADQWFRAKYPVGASS